MRLFSYFKRSVEIIRRYGITAFFRKIQFFLVRKFSKKTEPHFVIEYQNYVNKLLKVYPRDEAMRKASNSAFEPDCGCGYIEKGNLQKEILILFGLQPNMSIIDLGCGSGCLARALPDDFNLNYLGIDVIEELLDYAKKKQNKNYKFRIHKKFLTMPVMSESIDMICAFEIFPLLLQEEIFIYLEDMKRALKKGGKVIFSFLEYEKDQHRQVFYNAVNDRKKKINTHLNTFLDRAVLQMWADKIGFKIVEFIDGDDKKFNGKNNVQSLAVFEKIS